MYIDQQNKDGLNISKLDMYVICNLTKNTAKILLAKIVGCEQKMLIRYNNAINIEVIKYYHYEVRVRIINTLNNENMSYTLSGFEDIEKHCFEYTCNVLDYMFNRPTSLFHSSLWLGYNKIKSSVIPRISKDISEFVNNAIEQKLDIKNTFKLFESELLFGVKQHIDNTFFISIKDRNNLIFETLCNNPDIEEIKYSVGNIEKTLRLLLCDAFIEIGEYEDGIRYF